MVLDKRTEIAYGIVLLLHAYEYMDTDRRCELDTEEMLLDKRKELEAEYRSYRYVEVSDLQGNMAGPRGRQPDQV